MPPSGSPETARRAAFWWKSAALPARALLIALAVAVLGALFIFMADIWITMSAADAIHETLPDTPPTGIALVLGTSKYIAPGKPNAYYAARMKAAAALYMAGGVRGMVVSGDNSTIKYNEPQRMRQDLAELGVPDKFITNDYAGFRTLDSIVRMKEVFGFDRYTIVSQRFHLERAVYIARAYGHNPVGYAAETPPGGLSLKVRVRELLARALAVLDVNVFRRAPKFLGPRISPPLGGD